MEKKDFFRFTIFSNLMTLFITGLAHVSSFIMGVDFNIVIYPVIVGFITLICLFLKYVFIPFEDYFYNKWQ